MDGRDITTDPDVDLVALGKEHGLSLRPRGRTHSRRLAISSRRFAIAGVSPLHQRMVDEDRGVERAFNRVLTLAPMSIDEAEQLLGQSSQL